MSQQPSPLALPAHPHPVQSLAFSHSGEFMATGDTGRNVRAWYNAQPFFEADIRTRNDKARAMDRIRAIAFSPDGKFLLAASGDTVRAFDLLTRQEAWFFQPRRTLGFLIVSPVALAVSPSGNIVACMDNGTVVALDGSGRVMTQWWHNDGPRHAAFMPDGMGIVGAEGFNLSIWEAYSGRRIQSMRSKERILGMAVAPLENLVATRTLHYIELTDLRTMTTFDRITAPAGLPLIAFSPNGGTLALAGRAEVLLMDLRTRQSMVLPTNGARVLSITFHPASAFLAAGCSDGIVRFWDVFASSTIK